MTQPESTDREDARQCVHRTADDGAGGLLLSGESVPGMSNCLGVVTLPPGFDDPDEIRHEADEAMYVAAGSGTLLSSGETIRFTAGDAIFIPRGAWHSLSNTGDADLVSVFTFTSPGRPPTESRPRNP